MTDQAALDGARPHPFAPCVSIVTPFYNAERFLEETIRSVLAQEFDDWELLLADDGSTDGSTDLAKSYAERFPDRIFYIEHEGHANHGASPTRNLAMRTARGRYLAWLDSDDVWFPNKLKEQVQLLDSHPAVGMVCGVSNYWRSWTGRPQDALLDWEPDPGLPTERIYDPPELALRRYPLGNAAAPCPSSLLVRREVCERIGGFEADFVGSNQMYEDQAFLTKVYLETPVYVSSRCWLHYRQHGASCVSTVTNAGEYESVRRFFLEWLERYLASNRITETAVLTAIARARRGLDFPPLAKWERRFSNLGSRVSARLTSLTSAAEPRQVSPTTRSIPDGPKVTVIIPFLNPGTLLRDAVESVCAQSFDDWELFLVDDGSTDGSGDIAREMVLQRPDRIRLMAHENQRNRGKSLSCNAALSLASGEYLSVLDADDLWLPEKLKRETDLLDLFSEAPVLLTPSITDGEVAPWASSLALGRVAGAVALNALLSRETARPSLGSPLYRLAAVASAGGFIPGFRHLHAELALLTKITLKHPVVVSHEARHRSRETPTSCYPLVRQLGRLESECRMFHSWFYSQLRISGVRDAALWSQARSNRRRYAGAPDPGQLEWREC